MTQLGLACCKTIHQTNKLPIKVNFVWKSSKKLRNNSIVKEKRKKSNRSILCEIYRNHSVFCRKILHYTWHYIISSSCLMILYDVGLKSIEPEAVFTKTEINNRLNFYFLQNIFLAFNRLLWVFYCSKHFASNQLR